jgi:hypothetical protein
MTVTKSCAENLVISGKNKAISEPFICTNLFMYCVKIISARTAAHNSRSMWSNESAIKQLTISSRLGQDAAVLNILAFCQEMLNSHGRTVKLHSVHKLYELEFHARE